MAHSANPSPQYIETDERAAVLEMLAHVHEFSQLVVVLTGEVGSGRSMLLQQMSDQLSVHYQTLLFSASDYSSLEEVQYVVAMQLGCVADSQEIEQSLKNMAIQSEPFHILVDDAQLLSDEALTYLIAHSQGEHRWQLMVTGDPVLHQMCVDVQHNLQSEEKLHHAQLQPFSEEATTQFLQGFYRQSGIDHLPLSDKALHHYWRLSSGLPGNLVTIVDTQFQTADSSTSSTSNLPLGHIAAVVLIGSALLISYLYKSPSEENIEDDAIARLIAGEAVVTEVVDADADDVTPSQQAESPQQVIAEKSVPHAVDSTNDSLPMKTEELAVEPAQVVQERDNDQPVLDRAEEFVHPLLSAKPSDFGLQLVGVRSKKSAQAVIDQFGSQLGENKLSIYTTQYKGQPWYVVVYAPITGKESANETANKLSTLMSTQPWVRPMEKIQEDIRKNDQITD
ncbi:AAA family ATPase [Bermanella marisrubri]|uniref:SPOR domain-containing protein n=1 Tax=Bermanella marisrubri TaxID=207949 RepID=Q1N2I7_9GAMM|nr:AAA family ATPase [Bermanella marisrubri]EAT12420.1 hypothetical protein RED65_16321 [Oceanobacter sp. RED65] [Bermanella marisrubri]QIZ85501.1 AAA family ATPase [Bermanella marisrubri]